MRLASVSLVLLASAAPAYAQSGPCTESAVKQGTLPASDDVFAYMPAFGKPTIGRQATQQANKENFSARTNITRAWASDHRIVAAPSGEMAYESGTMHMGYDENGKHEEFDAVMLTVFKASKGVCQTVAFTMEPLETQPKR